MLKAGVASTAAPVGGGSASRSRDSVSNRLGLVRDGPAALVFEIQGAVPKTVPTPSCSVVYEIHVAALCRLPTRLLPGTGGGEGCTPEG